MADTKYRVTAGSVAVRPAGSKTFARHRQGAVVEIPQDQAERLLDLKAIEPLDEDEEDQEGTDEEVDEIPDRPEDGSTDREAWATYAKYYEIPFAHNAGAAKIEEAVKKAEADE